MDIPTDWLRALAGGAVIGVSATLMLALNGRVTGISGIAGGIVSPAAGDVRWRVMFVAGLMAGGLLMLRAMPEAFTAARVGVATAAVAGLLVGVGTRLGNGCTSGHGICGISRLAPRSLAATVTFIAAGALTVLLMGGAR